MNKIKILAFMLALFVPWATAACVEANLKDNIDGGFNAKKEHKEMPKR